MNVSTLGSSVPTVAIPEEGVNHTWRAMILLLAFAICLSAPELTDVRRPFHDTVGLFYGRIFMTDAVRNGAFPFWYPYARYSMPFYSLEGGMGWSPIGFLVGAIAPYNLFSWAVEGLVWNVICLSGAFLFARRHVTSPYSAAAAAITYAASGLLLGTVPTIGTTRAMQVGPWIFVAIDTLVRPAQWDRVAWARGTTTLAVAGMLWLTGGYPGIWLTAPVLVVPYALLASRGRIRALTSIVTSATISALLALGMCALLIDGTFNLPRDTSPGDRPGLSPADGALALRSLIHTFLANPGYLRDSSGGHEPLYLGAAFLPGLLMVRPIVPTSILQVLPDSIRLLFLACTTLGIAVAGVVAGATNPWMLILFGIACLASIPTRHVVFTSQDISLLLTTAFGTALASSNPIGDFFRAHVWPFSMIRWNDWYLWVAMLCLSTYVWRNIDQQLLSKTADIYFNIHISTILITFSGIATLMLGVSSLSGPSPVDYDVIHSLTYTYVIAQVSLLTLAALLAILLALRVRTDASHALIAFWLVAFIVIPLGSGLMATAQTPGDDQTHRLAMHVGRRFFFLWDVIQAIALPITTVGLVLIFRRRIDGSRALAIFATCAAIDMSLAAPRVLSHTEYLRAGQVGKPTPIDRAFAFSGNERMPSDDILGGGSSMYNAFQKRPDQFRFPGAEPQMAAYDEQSGSPSLFSRFVRFPDWWGVPSDDSTHRVLQSTAGFHGWDDHVQLPEIVKPRCSGQSTAPPAGTVTKLLPDRTVIRTRSDCAQLAVLMDTWAPGWTVLVDDTPSPAIRVNGVLRGVEVPAGDHTITWLFRPERWSTIVAVTLGSVGLTLALGAASIRWPKSLWGVWP
ncbi:MAG: hypothetical protein KGR25_04710 [Chloroflexi bacterium]|nr:hypothetical protein [Chloroflexota bacterium]